MNSIQTRLTTGLLISLSVVFLILWLAVSSNIQRLSENYIASRLEHDIESLLTAISFDETGSLNINEQYLNAIYKRPYSGHYYTIQYKNNLYRSRSLWDKNLTIAKATDSDYLKSIQSGPEKQSLITITRHFKKQSQSIIVSIAEDLTPVIADINHFKNYFSVLSIFILIILLLIQYIVLRKGLKPLRKIQNELSELEKGTINELSTDVPHELKSIVSEVNQLSLALYKRLKRSRNALSDLSHAIKKPLTLLQNFSDENNENLSEHAKEYLNNQISSIQHITDRILKRARVAGTSKHSTAFKINDDLPLLIKTITAMYPQKDIKTTLDVPDNIDIQIDRDDMLEILGNLLDNAWKWADTEIKINFEKAGNIKVIIEDDGAGGNIESLNELTQRGVRLDESVSGYGFGLAISSDIVRDYEGSLSFSRSEELGGFKVEVQLPISY